MKTYETQRPYRNTKREWRAVAIKQIELQPIHHDLFSIWRMTELWTHEEANKTHLRTKKQNTKFKILFLSYLKLCEIFYVNCMSDPVGQKENYFSGHILPSKIKGETEWFKNKTNEAFGVFQDLVL